MTNGGFVFHCKHGQTVQVSEEQANALKSKCEYFQSVFAHGTTETNDLVLKKPDWTAATAKALVQLMTTGEVTIPDYADYVHLAAAADQILMSDNMHPLLPAVVKDRNDTPPEGIDAILRYLESNSGGGQNAWTLHTSRKMPIASWQGLLSQNIWLGLSEDGMVVKFGESSQTRTHDSLIAFLNMCDAPIQVGMGSLLTEKYRVKCEAKSTGLALNKICGALRSEVPDSSANGNRKKCFTEEENSIRVPCMIGLHANAIVEAIKKNKIGIRAYVHHTSSLGYYLDGGGGGACPTFFGSFQQLNEALQMIPENFVAGNKCALRVCAPRDENLLRLLAATQHCQDNPGTLGVDINANAYFAVKTIGDMKILLSRLATNNSTDLTAQQHIQVVELTYPKGVF